MRVTARSVRTEAKARRTKRSKTEGFGEATEERSQMCKECGCPRTKHQQENINTGGEALVLFSWLQQAEELKHHSFLVLCGLLGALSAFIIR